MILRAVRVCKAKHAQQAFSGEGARTHGGRWNSPGHAAVYAAATQSLAMLELLVHLGSADLLGSFVVFELTFSAELVTPLDAKRLPKGWRAAPPPRAVQKLGDDWLARAASPVLRLPSAVVPAECNYLLNPAHPRFAAIRIGPAEPIAFDPRLVKSAR